MRKIAITIILVLLLSLVFTACANYGFADEGGDYIVTAKEAIALADEGAIFVDARGSEDFSVEHVEGALCLPMAALVKNEPYKNMLADKEQIVAVMSALGVTQEDTLLVYDASNNMEAARIQWTLNYYSNFNVKVVSGGYNVLVKQGAKTTSKAPVLTEAEYKLGDKQRTQLVSLNNLKAKIDEPQENQVIIDTRSAGEFAEGTIPGSINIEYMWNNYANGEYKTTRDIRLTYIEKGINPDDLIILFCKTSVRAAQTYTALRDAGFSDVRVYDGAWLEYEARENPVPPVVETAPVQGDAS